jgi:tetratricopeptide (TPR) repeat protein/NAD-dependent SIR2 family protein deacetylase
MAEDTKPQPRRASVRQLAHKIKGTGVEPSPRFAFFLGAGASVESGIPLAGAMMDDWCQRIIQEQCPEDCTGASQQKTWLEEQPWYAQAKRAGTLYSDLFEMYETKERGRQAYIERMIEGRKPSFGYVVLANLMARNYVNTVLTTNFDDLIYSSCSTYTDLRPVMYAYGTMVSDLRITNSRPKILKLHGDYLYSKLKNSRGELEHQDPNMSRYVSAMLSEYGLVVIGYSGCDNSVMEMLRNFPPNNDLFWCGRTGSPIPEPVRDLLIRTDGVYVEIDSFDQMMNEIRSIVGFDVDKMLGSLQTRQDQIIDQLKTFPRSLSNLSSLLREIYEFLQRDERQKKRRKDEAFMHYVIGYEAWQKREFPEAEAGFRAALKLDPEDFNARIALAGVLSQEGMFAESESEIKQARQTASGDSLVQALLQLGYLYMVQGRHAEALVEYTEAIRLAPQSAIAHTGAGIAYMNLARFDEAAAALRKSAALNADTYYAAFNLASVLAVKGEQAESRQWWLRTDSQWQDRDPIDPYNRAIIDACLGKPAEAKEEMRQAIERGQPGLARLALDSVVMLESAPLPIPGMTELGQMLKQAAGEKSK